MHALALRPQHWVDTPFYAQIYTTFYCRQNEPSYIKSLKLDILAAIADETNAFDIATELTEYVNDIDEQLARDAVKAVGRIAIEVSRLGAPLVNTNLGDVSFTGP